MYWREVSLEEGRSDRWLLQESRQELRVAWTGILGVEIQKNRQI